MSNTRRIRSNTTTGTAGDHVMVDDDDDDDELILVFPSGGGNDCSNRNHSWLTPTNNQKPPPPPIQLRPRYIPPSTKIQLFSTSSTSSGDDHVIATTTTCTNGTHFRLSPSIASRSIQAMLHHGGSVGDGNTRSGNLSNQIHRTPLSLMHHHGNHRPQLLCYNNSSSPRLDQNLRHHFYPRMSDQNHTPRSPDKTPITATIPCLPIIPSPPSADAGDVTGTPDHHVANYDPWQGRGFREDTTGSNVQVAGRSEQSNPEATAVSTRRGADRTRTAASQVQQLPITTATLAASLRMRKQQAQLLPSPKLF